MHENREGVMLQCRQEMTETKSLPESVQSDEFGQTRCLVGVQYEVRQIYPEHLRKALENVP
jgi:hypothetical protein